MKPGQFYLLIGYLFLLGSFLAPPDSRFPLIMIAALHLAFGVIRSIGDK